MTRYLIDVYKVEIPDNGQRRDDISEATEDWLGKAGRAACYQFQIQGNSLNEIAERFQKLAAPKDEPRCTHCGCKESESPDGELVHGLCSNCAS